MTNSKANLMYNNGAKKDGTDVYYTPKWVSDKLPLILGKDFLDPCPGAARLSKVNYDSLDNGLGYSWKETGIPSFVNPPFSDMCNWIDKACLEADQGHKSLWFTKMDLRTKWGEQLLNSANSISVIKGYVKYLKEDGSEHTSATFQTCFVTFGDISIKKVQAVFADRIAFSQILNTN